MSCWLMASDIRLSSAQVCLQICDSRAILSLSVEMIIDLFFRGVLFDEADQNHWEH